MRKHVVPWRSATTPASFRYGASCAPNTSAKRLQEDNISSSNWEHFVSFLRCSRQQSIGGNLNKKCRKLAQITPGTYLCIPQAFGWLYFPLTAISPHVLGFQQNYLCTIIITRVLYMSRGQSNGKTRSVPIRLRRSLNDSHGQTPKAERISGVEVEVRSTAGGLPTRVASLRLVVAPLEHMGR